MNPYRNTEESMELQIQSLIQENNELHSEIQRLQSLFDVHGKAIVVCPVDEVHEIEDFEPRDESLRKIGIFLTLVQGFLFFVLLTGSVFDKDYLYAAILSAFFINVVAGIAFLYSRQSWR